MVSVVNMVNQFVFSEGKDSSEISGYCDMLTTYRESIRSESNEVLNTLKSYTIAELNLLWEESVTYYSSLQKSLTEKALNLNASTHKAEIAYYYAVTWVLIIPLSNSRAAMNELVRDKDELCCRILDFLLLLKVLQQTAPASFSHLILDTEWKRYLEKMY